MPLISIVVPVFNSAKFISRCIDSILNQTFQDFELILVDDCSQDNSLEIIQKYSDNRIKVIVNESRVGTALTRKTGYLAAMGQYLMFCDSDDWLPSESLHLLYRTINQTDSDIVIGNYDICIDENIVKSTFTNQLKYGFDRISIYKSLLLRDLSHSLCGRLFKTVLFQCDDNHEVENFTNSEDGFVFYQVFARSNKVELLNQSVYCYFINVCSSSRKRLGPSALDNMAFFCCSLKKNLPNDQSLVVLRNRYISHNVFHYMLNGSHSFASTFRVLKKYHLLKYLNPFYCSDSISSFLVLLKILIKSIIY